MTFARAAVARRLLVGLMLLAGVAPRAAAAPARAPTFFEVVAAHFDQWDADHDGKLSAAELARLVADRRVRGPQAAAVAAIALVARGDAKAPPGGLTRAHFAALGKGRPAAKAGPPYAGLYAAGNRHLAAAGPPPVRGRRPVAARLPAGADCRLLRPRPTGGAGGPRPGRRPPDGPPAAERVVPGGPRQPGHRPRPGPDGRRGHHVRRLGRPRGVDQRVRAGVRGQPGQVDPTGRPRPGDLDGIAHAGSTAATMAALTGHRVRALQVRADANHPPARAAAGRVATRVDRLLREAVKARRLVCASSAAKQATPGLVPAHAHAVVGYDPAARQVKLWNPHGNAFAPAGPAGPANGYPTADGFFTMPLADFVGAFRAVYAEGAK